MIGIRNFFRKSATQSVSNANTGVIPVDITDLSGFSLAAGQKAHAVWWIPFTLGATGGFRFLFLASQTPVSNTVSFEVYDCTTANTFFAQVQTALPTVAFTNASAVAGNYIARVIADINGHATVAGTFGLQYAQNNATANANVIQIGASCDVIYL